MFCVFIAEMELHMYVLMETLHVSVVTVVSFISKFLEETFQQDKSEKVFLIFKKPFRKKLENVGLFYDQQSKTIVIFFEWYKVEKSSKSYIWEVEISNLYLSK